MKPQMAPHFPLSPVFYAIEAMDLARRAGRGDTPWSQSDPEASRVSCLSRPSDVPSGLRRTTLIAYAFILVGASVMTGWML